MATFDAKAWWRLQLPLGPPSKSKEFKTFQKIVTASNNDLLRNTYLLNGERFLRAVATLKSQGEEEASRVLAQDLLVSVQN